jgi:hypothetical protein
MSRIRVRALLVAVLFGAAVVTGPVMKANADPGQDQQLYDFMYQQWGIILYPQAYSQARRDVCGVTWGGYSTPDEVVDAFMDANPGWSYDQARGFVAASIAIYCPPPNLVVS